MLVSGKHVNKLPCWNAFPKFYPCSAGVILKKSLHQKLFNFIKKQSDLKIKQSVFKTHNLRCFSSSYDPARISTLSIFILNTFSLCAECRWCLRFDTTSNWGCLTPEEGADGWIFYWEEPLQLWAQKRNWQEISPVRLQNKSIPKGRMLFQYCFSVFVHNRKKQLHLHVEKWKVKY